jgi:DNA-binding response OmpR family regulator
VDALIEYWRSKKVPSIPLLILLDAFSRTNHLNASIGLLKNIRDLAAVPIIMMIGSEHEKDYLRSRSLDVSGYVIKPVSGQQLQQYLGLK